MTDPLSNGGAPVLEVRNLSKRFDMTQALDDVSLRLHAGEIHALVGENGAGKSTLIKILTGVVQSDAGEVFVEGEAVHLANAQEAQAAGLAAVYQEPLLFPDLDVAENIFITHREQGLLTNWRRMYAEAEEILASLGVRLDVRAPARGLTLAAQQAVEIAKAISLEVKVLIMDEPTASLSEHEVGQLFRAARQLRDRGVTVLFITHRLEEVFQIADRITVLRDGEHVSTRPAPKVTRELLIRDMVGREVDQFYGVVHERTVGERVCCVRGLGREGVFSGIDFDLHAGEALGFAGLVGSRRDGRGPGAVRHAAGRPRHHRDRRPGAAPRLAAGGPAGRRGLHDRGPPQVRAGHAAVDHGQHHAAGAAAATCPGSASSAGPPKRKRPRSSGSGCRSRRRPPCTWSPSCPAATSRR